MTTQEVQSLVEQGIAAYNAGDPLRARALLTEAVQRDPRHEIAWLWMSAAVHEPAERRFCLERVLDINPQHSAAQRGLAKFPADLRSCSPLPPVPEPVLSTRCTYPGCREPVSRTGHTLCYDHWKQAKRHKGTSAAPTPTVSLLTASQLGEQLDLSSQRVNLLLAELGWIEQRQSGWIVLPQGQQIGATQRHHPESEKPYVVWPESVRDHKVLRAALRNLRGETSESTITQGGEQTFRKRFPAQHRTTDGHLVRSKAEMLIDNWLYMSGVVHAYERQLPIEEEVYCDFYLPTGKVYIEYWGLENDPAYNTRRKAKLEIYQKYTLHLIELTDDHIRNLDDHLPKILLKYGITVM